MPGTIVVPANPDQSGNGMEGWEAEREKRGTKTSGKNTRGINGCKKSRLEYREGISLLEIREINILRGMEKSSRGFAGNAFVPELKCRFHPIRRSLRF
jgi:hypothetical protein